MEAIREGMAEIIPVETLRYLTWQEMEALVVGRVDFDVEWLKKRTRYYGMLLVLGWRPGVTSGQRLTNKSRRVFQCHPSNRPNAVGGPV